MKFLIIIFFNLLFIITFVNSNSCICEKLIKEKVDENQKQFDKQFEKQIEIKKQKQNPRRGRNPRSTTNQSDSTATNI